MAKSKKTDVEASVEETEASVEETKPTKTEKASDKVTYLVNGVEVDPDGQPV
jgi:hypothetical protein